MKNMTQHESLVLGTFVMVLFLVIVMVVMFILFATGVVPSDAKKPPASDPPAPPKT
jgi:hypothetical protein